MTTDDRERQSIIDDEHLRLLRIGYFTMGGVSAFTGLFGALYAAMGFFIAHLPMTPAQPNQPPPEMVGWIFAAFGCAFMLAAGTYALLAFLTARALRRRSGRGLCLATAAISCLYIPFGTLLGVFTFIALGRPSVRALFDARKDSATPDA